ncbi:leucyl/phenylalanyl-tRNA--protein transferase [uncultured Neptuniibacter sp.]|uniref:leucyl/phenylalanyl-tRNA--protein transferase n=1 Tax=uncultured Neptuniibacter sp. TaxID=502143 RepID=UPI0026329B68|nr:leucyl/phenylalanyl-tRNA--protein transferase [uncultured Neptuniibacter sp.]
MIPWLHTASDPFPPVELALSDPNGLLAAGGTLSEERLVQAYRQGIFPWYSPGEPILWWSPDPRCVLFPDQLHISRSMRKRLNKKDYSVCFDRNFSAVVDACAAPRRDADGTWITDEIKSSYALLHQHGIAHSVEVYIEDKLVGGLYGIAMGKLFFGESMFSRSKDASKIAFIHLVEQLKKWDYALIDCQVSNNHLFSLGATEIQRAEFKQHLHKHLDTPVNHIWTFDTEIVVRSACD